MQYIAETREFQIKEKTVVSIGKFDGLHRGHQKLMHEMLKWKEQGFKIAVFTFATPPWTLVKGKMQTMIMTNPGARDAPGAGRRGLYRGVPV